MTILLFAVCLIVTMPGCSRDSLPSPMASDASMDLDVIGDSATCSDGGARADACGGCLPAKFMFSRSDGCANDGSLEFCIPPSIMSAAQAIAPQLNCRPGGGRAMCDASTQLLCSYPTGDPSTCVTTKGALTEAAYAQLCRLSTLPEITKIVRTILE